MFFFINFYLFLDKKFKSTNEIGPSLMNRAVYLHNQICSLLLAAYESLQDHIAKMSQYLSEYQRKNLKIGRAAYTTNLYKVYIYLFFIDDWFLFFFKYKDYVDCKEKLRKITEIIQVRVEINRLLEF